MKNKKLGKPMPTIETVWKKPYLTQKQYTKILQHMGGLEFSDENDPDECRRLLNASIKMIRGLLDRAILLDAYKDMTSDLHCTCNIELVPTDMRKLFIFLGPEGKEIKEDAEWKAWREG